MPSNPNKLNANHVLGFYLYCKHGNAKEAAYRMKVSSASISHFVAELERVMGAQLTKTQPAGNSKDAPRFALTEFGSKFLLDIQAPMKLQEEILVKYKLLLELK